MTIKQAEGLVDTAIDTVKDKVWSPEAGPFENTFSLIGTGAMLAGVPGANLLMLGLGAVGYTPDKLGKLIDDKFGLHSIEDATKLDPTHVAKTIMGDLSGVAAEAGTKTSHFNNRLFKQANPPAPQVVHRQPDPAQQRANMSYKSNQEKIQALKQRSDDQIRARREQHEREHAFKKEQNAVENERADKEQHRKNENDRFEQGRALQGDEFKFNQTKEQHAHQVELDKAKLNLQQSAHAEEQRRQEAALQHKINSDNEQKELVRQNKLDELQVRKDMLKQKKEEDRLQRKHSKELARMNMPMGKRLLSGFLGKAAGVAVVAGVVGLGIHMMTSKTSPAAKAHQEAAQADPSLARQPQQLANPFDNVVDQILKLE